MPAWKTAEAYAGVGIGDKTYAVIDGILILPDGVDLGDHGDEWEPTPMPAGGKATILKAPPAPKE